MERRENERREEKGGTNWNDVRPSILRIHLQISGIIDIPAKNPQK